MKVLFIKRLKWQNFLMLAVSGIINALGVTLFLAPAQLFDGGLSGTSMLLWQLTPEYLTLPVFLVALNLPFFLFGLKVQGAEFTVYSLYAVTVYSLAALAIGLMPFDLSVSPIAGDDMLLCALFGGLVSGIGSGLTIRFGGAIDGVEVMAVIFARRVGLTVGSFVMIYNAVLYVAAGFIFMEFAVPLYSVIAYAVGLKAVDYIVEGFDKAKAALIITDNSAQLGAALSEAFGRGLTLWDARGYFSGKETTVLYCVVNRFQINKLKKLVAEYDSSAFVTISEITDTLGTSLRLGARHKKKGADAQPNESSSDREDLL